MNVYTFHHLHKGQRYFSPLELENDDQAIEMATSKPDTVEVRRIDQAGDTTVIWEAPKGAA